MDPLFFLVWGVVCVLGMLGNGVVIWVTGSRMEETVSNVWYLNLAVADFTLSAFPPLLIRTGYAGNTGWLFDKLLCTMGTTVFHMNMFVSAYTLVAISVDRCFGVVWPAWARSDGYRTVRNASWVSLGVWLLAVVLSLPHLIVAEVYRACYFNPLPLTVLNFIMGFLVPFSIVVFCYSVIIYQIRNNKRSLAGRSGPSFKLIAAVITVFYLCWIPYLILLPIYVHHYINTGYYIGKVNPDAHATILQVQFIIAHVTVVTLGLVHGCLNPLLYVFSQGFKVVFRCRSIPKVLEKVFAEEPPQTNSTPTTDPDVLLSEIEGSAGPPGTRDPPGDCPV